VIPRANITAWRAQAPWPTDAQVEHDLVLSRALVQIFQHDGLTTALAFRGGTAIHKLLFPAPQRYSEDWGSPGLKEGQGLRDCAASAACASNSLGDM
jgi:predicted nucleotidyltransferase component of viral defense system